MSNKSKQMLVSVLVFIVVVLWVALSDNSAPASTSDVASMVTEPTMTMTDNSDTATDTTTQSTEGTEYTEGTDVQPVVTSSMLADSGFNVKTDGFSFENYGNAKGVSNLKANDMRRLFGDKVCTRIKNNKCTLTSPARQWMKEINDAMDGGHCEGMAVASLTMFHKIQDSNVFGAPTTNDLALDGNTPLQTEIAYWWATQATEPTMSSMITGQPSDIIKLLAASLGQGQNAATFYSIGIYMADGSGGHAVTPVSISDLGDGKVGLNIYDNNWPNELRTIDVDLNDETWSYQASTNPDEEESLYTGTELELTPSTPRLQPQECDFCRNKGVKSTTQGLNTFILSADSATTTQQANTIGTSLFVTPEGQRIGYVDGKLINEIAGASVRIFKSAPTLWSDSGLPIFRIPAGVTVTMQIANDPSYQYSVSAYGDGKVVKIAKLAVSATKISEVNFGEKIGSVRIKSAVKTSPDIYIGDEENSNYKDSATLFSNIDLDEEGKFDIIFDEETDQFSIDGDIISDFDLDIFVSDDEGDYEYSTNDLRLDAGAELAFDVNAIDSENADLIFQYDENGDGLFETQTDVQDDNTSQESDTEAYNDLLDY